MAQNKLSGLGEKLWLGPAAATGGLAFDISGDIGSLDSVSLMLADMDDTGIDKSSHERLPGLIDASIQYTGFFNPGAGRGFTVAQGLVNTDAALIWALGSAEGSAAFALEGILSDFPVNRANNGAVTIKPKMESDAGVGGWGWLAANATDTVGSSHVVGNDARASTLGATLFVLVEGFTGTSATITVNDSADGTTFAAVSGLQVTVSGTTQGYYVASIPFTATLRQYWKVVTAGTFSSMQFQAALIRA